MLMLGVLAILLYANTLRHGFVLDDDTVLVRNQYVQEGWSGLKAIFTHDSFAGFERVGEGNSLLTGGRYRPLSLGMFAILYAFFGLHPFVFHLFSVLVYALTGVLLYRVLLLVLKNVKYFEEISFVTAALFILHPLHTEVVANVKSVDEILALFFGLLAMHQFFQAYESSRPLPAWLASLWIWLACLAKENAITFLVILPLGLWFFRNANIWQVVRNALPLAIGVGVFLMMRESALGGQAGGTIMHDPLNNPFMVWNGQQWEACAPVAKWATIIYTCGRCVALLVVPYPLTHDYYPFHILLQSFSQPWVWVSLIILLLAGGYALWSLNKRHACGFGIIVFLLTWMVTSNIFFPVGTFMAERFLFLPSLGFILTISILVTPIAIKRQWIFGVLLLIGVLFSMLTIRRNPAWKDNETLMMTDIQRSTNSARLQNALGTHLLEKARSATDARQQQEGLHQALPHLRKAIELHPTYYDALLAYGACTFYVSQFDTSVASYRRASNIYPGDPSARVGLVYALRAYGEDQWTKKDTSGAVQSLEEAWTLQPDSLTAVRLSGYYLAMGQSDKSRQWRDQSHGKTR